MGRGDLTVHGFRSTFRDWAGEATAHPREVIEHALAHRLTDAAEAAYQRGDLLQKRRKLMADWAAFLAKPAARGDVDRPATESGVGRMNQAPSGRRVVMVDDDTLLAAINTLRGHLTAARQAFDGAPETGKPDRLKSSLLAASGLYQFLNVIDPKDVDGHRAVVMELMQGLASIRGGSRRPEWMAAPPPEAENGSQPRGRPPGKRDDDRTWRMRTQAAIALQQMIESGSHLSDGDGAIAHKLNDYGIKVKSGTVSSWREKLQEGEASAPAACVENYHTWGEGSAPSGRLCHVGR